MSPTRSRGSRSGPLATPPSDSASQDSNGANGGASKSLSFEDMMALGSSGIAGQQVAQAETRRLSVAAVERIERTVEEMGAGKAQEGVREKILNASYATVDAGIKADERDIAKAMEALQEIAGGMDVEFKQLNEPTEEEKKLVVKAQAKVAEIRAKIDRREKAGFFKNLFGSKESDLASLDVDLKAAEEAVKQAETETQALIRERLRNADMTASLQTLDKVATRTVEIISLSVVMLGEKIKMLDTARLNALKEKEKAAVKMRALDATLAEQELELKQLEEELTTVANGTVEYGALEEKISNLRVKIEGTRGDKAVATTRFQAEEVGAKDIALHLLSLMKQRDVNRARIMRTTSETDTRKSTYAARLAGMKVQSEQQFDAQIGIIGTKTDSGSRMFAAESMVASGDALMKDLEDQPEKLAEIHKVLTTLAEHLASMNKRAAAVDEAMRNNAGLDEGEISVLRFTEDGAAAPEPAAPTS